MTHFAQFRSEPIRSIALGAVTLGVLIGSVALAYSLVGDAYAADDIVQDTWISALTARPSTAGGLRGWLRRVVVNRVRLRARRDSRQRELSRHVAVAAEAPSTLSLVERTQLQELLIQTVLDLDAVFEVIF